MRINKRIFAGMAVFALLFGLVLAGCASAPPTAFETAGSLEGTAWYQTSILVINDRTSGVFTDRDDKETAFTYTAVYDAQKRTFTGTINLEDGRVAEFSARKIAILGWALSAKELERASFFYATPERLEEIYRRKRELAELIKKYGIEYNGFNNITLIRNSDNLNITYDHAGLHPIQKVKGTMGAMQIVTKAWNLHSKDGVLITMFDMDTMSGQYASTEVVGTFNIYINGKNVMISNGAGAGAAFNGAYTADSDIDAQVTATHVQKQQEYMQKLAARASTQTQQPGLQAQATVSAQTQQTGAQAQATTSAQTQQTQAQATAPAPIQQTGPQPYDSIFLLNGNVIDASIVEISSSEIRYRPSNNLDGPIRVMTLSNVHYIRFKNGIAEVINAPPAPIASTAPVTPTTPPVVAQDDNPVVKQENAPVNMINPQTTAMDPDKLNFGISANPAGLLLRGPSICLELTKGHFNTELNLIFPAGLQTNFNICFGGLLTVNYFWPSRIGGAYLGGGIGYSFEFYEKKDWVDDSYYDDDGNWVVEGHQAHGYDSYHSLFAGINAGYKFVTSSGLYFRTGAFVGFDFGIFLDKKIPPVYYKADLAIGWTMR